jgi:hypothetical protein
MQSDTPQGDPRLQRTNPGPKVATGYVDPCIVYLETTAPGEIPLLGIGWATSSREVRDAGGGLHWELNDVGLVKGLYEKPSRFQKAKWNFSIRNTDHFILKHGRGNALSIDHPFFSGRFKSSNVLIPQWKFQFLSPQTVDSLQKILTERSSHPDSIARILLEQSKLDWTSVADALASLQPLKPLPRRPSFVLRLISSVFKKKKQKAVAV